MIPFTALLCLGLSVGAKTPVNAGTLPRPTLWAEPGSVILRGSPVTLWCQGFPGTQHFRLFGETIRWSLEEIMSPSPQNKATFSISSMATFNTGSYRCQYEKGGLWSELSEPVELVVTGYHRKPSLSALPSPVVTSGGTVTLRCMAREAFEAFILIQEGEPGPPRTLKSQRSTSGQVQALFSVGPVTPGRSWTFRCYGSYDYNPQEWSEPSGPLQLRVSEPSVVTRAPATTARLRMGTLPRPTLWAEPGSVILRGSPVTLWCQGFPGTQHFRLFGETIRSSLEETMSPSPQNKATFSISSMATFNTGSYRCQYEKGGLRSELSEPVELVVTGYHRKPSLSALPSPVVTSGGTVTLRCMAREAFEAFILIQEGEPGPPRTLKSQKSTSGQVQALFSVGPVTPGRSWTFRCYGSYDYNPQEWSEPSGPLQLRVSGPSVITRAPATTPRLRMGTLPRPTLWAEPGSVIPQRSPVTLWCQGSSGAQHFRLFGKTSRSSLEETMSPGPQNKAIFSISDVTTFESGSYRCQYERGGLRSELSEPLVLVVTGYHRKPSLSALPSPVVTSGGTVTLRCMAREAFEAFILIQEGEPGPPRTLESQRSTNGQVQALFSVGPVTPDRRWMFRCYGYYAYNPQEWSEPSDLLQLRVSEPSAVTRAPATAPRLPMGTLPRPTLWAEPGQVIANGSPVSLWCQGSPGAQSILVYREGSSPPWDKTISVGPQNKVKIPISAATSVHAGNYRCQAWSREALSEPSKPLVLVVTGFYSKPSLSSLPSPVVALGGTVTLQCGSSERFQGFVLAQEGEPLPSYLQSQPHPSGQVQALFLVGPVAPGRSWTFRCYGYYWNKTHKWSQPSDPLQLLVSGTSGVTRSPPRFTVAAPTTGPSQTNTDSSMGTAPTTRPAQNKTESKLAQTSQPRDHTVENLLRLGAAGFILLVLGILLLEARHSLRRPEATSH